MRVLSGQGGDRVDADQQSAGTGLTLTLTLTTLTLTLTRTRTRKRTLTLSLTRCRDFYMPVGGHVKLRTLPQCFNCGQDTEFTWLSCPWCRYSTKKRKRAKDPPESLPQG